MRILRSYVNTGMAVALARSGEDKGGGGYGTPTGFTLVTLFKGITVLPPKTVKNVWTKDFKNHQTALYCV